MSHHTHETYKPDLRANTCLSMNVPGLWLSHSFLKASAFLQTKKLVGRLIDLARFTQKVVSAGKNCLLTSGLEFMAGLIFATSPRETD